MTATTSNTNTTPQPSQEAKKTKQTKLHSFPKIFERVCAFYNVPVDDFRVRFYYERAGSWYNQIAARLKEQLVDGEEMFPHNQMWNNAIRHAITFARRRATRDTEWATTCVIRDKKGVEIGQGQFVSNDRNFSRDKSRKLAFKAAWKEVRRRFALARPLQR